VRASLRTRTETAEEASRPRHGDDGYLTRFAIRESGPFFGQTLEFFTQPSGAMRVVSRQIEFAFEINLVTVGAHCRANFGVKLSSERIGFDTGSLRRIDVRALQLRRREPRGNCACFEVRCWKAGAPSCPMPGLKAPS
jgi:hypothetical protein